MGNLNLLIVAESEEFCSELSRELQDTYRIRISHDGKEALQMASVLQPDMLVVNLMLPGLDGLSLIHEIYALGTRPIVLAVSPLRSEYIIRSLEHLNVSYFIQTPCQTPALVARIKEMCQLEKPCTAAMADPFTAVSNQLMVLGVPTKLNGFQYLRLAIPSMARDPQQSITKELYPGIAARCDASAEQVERCIRSAIQHTWKNRDAKTWDLFFPQRKALRAPSNGEFISTLAQRLILRPEEDWQQAL